MALLYLDTSALVKIYVDERGSERMRALALDAGNRLAICSLAQVEFHAAINKLRRQRQLGGEAVKQVAELFNSQFRVKFIRHQVDDWTLDLASALASRHPLRGYDAVQLAACLVLARDRTESPTFVCADRILLNAAEGEGLSVLNPEA